MLTARTTGKQGHTHIIKYEQGWEYEAIIEAIKQVDDSRTDMDPFNLYDLCSQIQRNKNPF